MRKDQKGPQIGLDDIEMSTFSQGIWQAVLSVEANIYLNFVDTLSLFPLHILNNLWIYLSKSL